MASQNHENNIMSVDNEAEGNTSQHIKSTSSDDDSHPNGKCGHIKSVKANKVEKKLKQGFLEINCMTCTNNNETPSTSTTDSNDAVSTPVAILICLTCAELHCGRDIKGHAIQHFNDNEHPISLNVETLQAWCYKCNDEIIPSTKNNQIISQVQAIIRKHLKKDEEDSKAIEPYDYEKPKRKWQYEITAPGLSNLGNTCFFNSVMQVVVGTSVLHDVLTPSDPYNDPPHIDATKCIAAKEDTENDAGPLTNAFKEFLRDMWRTREDTIAPRELFNQISKKWQQFRGWRQQDSQELMRFLFDGIKSEEIELIRKLRLQSQDPQDEDEERMDDGEDEEDLESNEDDTKKEVNEKYESFIDACFGGKLVSVIVCDVCKKCSYSYEDFLDVSLPIKSSPESKNSYGFEYNNNNNSIYHNSTYPFNNDPFKKNNEGSPSQTQSEDGSENEDENINEEESSDTEIEEGIPVPAKEERERIKLLLRDLPSDSGRSTPNSSKEPVTLRDCLKSFVKVETLENDNSFACDNCWKLKENYEKELREQELREKELREKELREQELRGQELRGQELREQELREKELREKELREQELRGQELREQELREKELREKELREKELKEKELKEKELKEKELREKEFDSDENLLDVPQNTESEGNGVHTQDDTQEGMMEDIQYTGESIISNLHNNVSNDSPPSESDSSRIDNENSPEASDINSSFNNNNSSYTYTNSLSTKSSKQVLQPERTYILRKAYKRYLFDSLPPVLVFHLKRFQQVGGRWSVSMKKIDDFVAFDEELDVGDFVVPPEIEKKNENGINNGHIIDDNNTHSLLKQNKKHTKYRLYGVVVHLGSLYNGHYIAYVLSRNIREGDHYGFNFSTDTIKKVDRIERQKHKTGSERQWIYCSDSSVRAANVDEVLKSGAYLLFYERVYE